MRILVYPHLMEIGGSQLNAIELASRIARRGHEVVLFAPRGPLVCVAEELGLDVVPVPRENAWPSVRNGARLQRLVTERGIEVVHGYEWGPALDVAFGVESFGRMGVVTTVLSMSVPHFLPRHSTLVVGTAKLLERQAPRRPGPTLLMEPPIDTDLNRSRDPAGARSRLGVLPGELVVSVVCRMTKDLDKIDGVLAAARVCGSLAAEGVPVRLVAAGDGPELGRLRRLAAGVNLGAGRDVVTVTGGLLDPSDVYDAADVVIGMGSSALKGMAFGKPLVVQGTAGFWQLFDEKSRDLFLDQGWFGDGGAGADDLVAALRPLLADPGRRAFLGSLGRDLVTSRFGLEAASDRLEEVYVEAAGRPPERSVLRRELTRTAYEFAKFRAVRFRQEHVQPRLRAAPVAGSRR